MEHWLDSGCVAIVFRDNDMAHNLSKLRKTLDVYLVDKKDV